MVNYTNIRCYTHAPSAPTGIIVVPCIHLSIYSSRTTNILFENLRYLPENLMGWCMVPCKLSAIKKAMFSHIFNVPQNFEFFYGKAWSRSYGRCYHLRFKSLRHEKQQQQKKSTTYLWRSDVFIELLWSSTSIPHGKCTKIAHRHDARCNSHHQPSLKKRTTIRSIRWDKLHWHKLQHNTSTNYNTMNTMSQ